MQNQWNAVPGNIWQGRDDSKESPIAKRVFQVIKQNDTFSPQEHAHKIALLGFMCDEGISLNKGRQGAKDAPNTIRQAMANFASQNIGHQLVDLGNIIHTDEALPVIQKIFSEHVRACHQNNLVTLVLGGGHETAFAHGSGLYDAYPDANIGIINFDAHLDIRDTKEASSGTPFKQLADYCQVAKRPFNYMCIGASLAANTEALLETAKNLDVKILWDTECGESNLPHLISEVQKFIKSVDIVYLTIDLDVLPAHEMFAVSALSALGVEVRVLIELAKTIAQTQKLKAVDLVEYSPVFDRDQQCAKVAARFAWQICHYWENNY